jgi:hypothetical protein
MQNSYAPKISDIAYHYKEYLLNQREISDIVTKINLNFIG